MAQIIEGASDFLYKTGNVIWAFQLDIASQVFGLKKKDDPTRGDLKDRTATVVSSEAPHRYVYGRARVGSSVVAVLSSGSRDEYKHLVCVHAAHECDAIEEVYIAGKALGTLDGSGYPTSGDYYKSTPTEASETFAGTGTTLAHTPTSIRLFRYVAVGFASFEWREQAASSYTLVGATISGLVSGTYKANYVWDDSYAYVRVLQHLGAAGQVADATTISEVPAKWDSTKTLSGMCYTIVRLDLNFQDFQSGPPTIEVLLRGKKLHDVRDVSYPNDTPVWSQNPALMIADYLTSEMCNVPSSDLPLAEYITAANVCDESTAYGSKYLADGVVDSDDDQRDVLEDMAQCMAGTIVSTTWGITAGKYVAPVLSLSQSDIVGDFSYTAGVPEAELYNGVKGKYISSDNLYVATDFAPYQNSTYVTADGAELWNDQDFYFTSTKQRVHNLCRIFVEDQRNGFTLNGDFSFKAWDLQIGERVTFTSAFLGQTSKVYRVLSKSFSADSAVKLTLKEDASTIWDLADAVTADDTPNTDLPNPFSVPAPANISITEDLYETTGSSGVKVKAIVTWDAPADVNVQDYEIAWKPYSDGIYVNTQLVVNEYAEILDLSDGQYDFKIRSKNHLNIHSPWSTTVTVTLYGLTALPANVQNFTVTPFNGYAIARWDRTTDLDVKIGGDIEIRFCPLTTGASWEQSVIIPDGKYNGDAISAVVSLGTGTYYAKFKDSSGNYSETESSFVVTEALITGWTTVQTSTQHTAFTGAKTDVFLDNNSIKLTGTSLFDDFELMDTLGYWDAIGGVATEGTYEFDATMDLTTSATRRFHSHIKAFAFNASDTIDSRTANIDTWDNVDGGVINGVNAITYISTSDDDVTYTAFAPFMVADFNCRYAKFKTILTSNDPVHNIQINELSVSAKIPA